MGTDKRQVYPSPFQRKTLWGAVTSVCLVVIGVIGVGLIWLSAKILAFLQPILVPLAIAGIIAYLLIPLVDTLVKRGLKRFHAMLAVYAAFNLGVVLLAFSVIPATFNQAYGLYQDRENIRHRVGDYVDRTAEGLDKRYGDTAFGRAMIGWFKVEQVPVPRASDDDAIPGEKAKSNTGPNPPPAGNTSSGDTGETDDTAGEGSEIDDDKGEDGEPTEQPDIVTDPRYNIAWDRVSEWLSEQYPLLVSKTWDFVTSSVQGVLGFLGYFIGLFLVPIYLFFFMKESASIARSWSDYLPLKTSRFKDEVVDTLSEINEYLIAFFRGQMLVSMIDGVLIAICLTLIGLPYAVLIGVFVALLGLIPYIGNLLCLIPALLISIAHFSNPENQLFGIEQVWIYPIIVMAIFFVTQQINGLVTAPRIVGDAVGLHPLTVIFSMFFWTLLIGGFLGSLLAVPLTACVKVLFRRYIWERKLQPGLKDRGPPEELGITN